MQGACSLLLHLPSRIQKRGDRKQLRSTQNGVGHGHQSNCGGDSQLPLWTYELDDQYPDEGKEDGPRTLAQYQHDSLKPGERPDRDSHKPASNSGQHEEREVRRDEEPRECQTMRHADHGAKAAPTPSLKEIRVVKSIEHPMELRTHARLVHGEWRIHKTGNRESSK